MSTAVELPHPVPDAQLPSLPHTLGTYDGPISETGLERHATLLATTRCAIHPLYRRSPGDCLTLLYRAKALSIPVGVAIDHIYINTATGKAGLSAQLIAALLRRNNVDWETREESDQAVEFWYYWGDEMLLARLARWRRTRRNQPPTPRGKARWTIGEAAGAGLTRRDRWQLWPTDCLWARAMARGSRRHFSHIVMGMGYTPEEVADMVDPDTAPAEETDLTIDPAVQDLLDAATAVDVTADTIRHSLIPQAKKTKLLRTELPDGRTLEQALNEAWLVATGQEAARRADAAMATPDTPDTQLAAPEVLDAPAGEGSADCGCPTAALISGQGHVVGVCRGVLATR